MSTRALYSLIPLVVLLGCSAFQREGDPDKSVGAKSSGTVARCTAKADCKVNIIVTSCAVGGIRAEPNTLRVANGLTGVTIVWTIRTSLTGVTFAEDGISFKDEIKEMSVRQFRAARRGPGGTFEWLDQNTAPGRFPYNVKVQHNGRDCPVHDPIVVNE